MARTRDKDAPGAAVRALKGSSNVRNDSWDWKKRVTKAKADARRDPRLAVCWLCGKPIDLDLPARHRMGFTLDHLVPVGRGGDVAGEAKPAHLSCNASRGDGRRTRRNATPPTLLDW